MRLSYTPLVLLFLFASTLTPAQQLETKGKVIVNDQGREVLLRGIGPGGWLLMEGYMMQTAGVAGTQHEFKNKLIDLMGEEKTDEFFEQWRKHHFTRRDVDSLAKWGFNSIRVPLHYNLFTLPIEEEPVAGEQTWLTTGFTILDSLLDWCKDNEMYLILDLHAAPGGQGKNADISDYDPTKPSLWESEENKVKTIELWRKLAERYKDEPWIGGYDLINEPNWELPGGEDLRELYERITEAIRNTGDEHILFIEGNWFANDFTGLAPPWDPNMVYSFHKYWNTNLEGDLDWVLPMREEHNVPLWMGESGENSNTWYTDAVTLFESNNIGWSWWTMRKIEAINSPYNIKMPSGYQKIIDYWKGQGPRPVEEEAWEGMMQLIENVKVENNDYHPDVIDALFRRVATDETIPYSRHSMPGTIYLTDFDQGKNEVAYHDTDVANYQLSTGEFQAWNGGWSYRNDGVDIEKNRDPFSNGHHIAFVKKGEWSNYTIIIEEEGVYSMDARVASEETGGKFHFTLDNVAITSVQSVESTGSWTAFQKKEIPGILLPKGEHILTFHVDGDIPFNISHVELKKSTDQQVDFKVLLGETGKTPNKIQLHFNYPLDPGSVHNENIEIRVNDTPIDILSFKVSDKVLELTLETALFYTDLIRASYSGSTIKNQESTPLESFSDVEIVNKLGKRFRIPGKIEAEDFENMSGFQLEDANDTGGGKNLAYVNQGDYAEYPVLIGKTSVYEIECRIAGLKDNGKFVLILKTDTGSSTLLEVSTEPTGGWQTWESQFSKVRIPAGFYTLRLEIVSNGEFNLNWIKFTDTITGLGKTTVPMFLYPNPVNDYLHISSDVDSDITIYSQAGKVEKRGNSEQPLDVRALSPGIYLVRVGDHRVMRFVKR